MKYYLLFLVSVLISSISQIVLKVSANRKHENAIKEYLNPLVIAAYGMFFFATMLTAMAYRGVPLLMGPVLEATGYVYVASLSVLILKEKMGFRKILGNVLIIVGIVVCTFCGMNI